MNHMFSTSSAISSPPDFLVLRVRGSTRDGQIVRLQSPKCTIGSGTNCTLRLQADNVAAVHCLILRGSNRTVVRRWSPDTRLNGRNFTESDLQVGDCLSIGAIDLEVVETAQPGLPNENLRDQQRTIDQQLAQIEVRLRSLDEQEAAWEARKAGLQQALDDRVAGLDALHVDLESQRLALEKECRQYEARLAELQLRESELEERGCKLESEIAVTAAPAVVSETPVPGPIASVPEPLAAEKETETKPVADAATTTTTVPSSAPPVDLAAVLRQAGFKIDEADEVDHEDNVQTVEVDPTGQVDRADEQGQSKEPVVLQEESPDGGAAAGPPIDISAPVPRSRNPAESGEEEVSIDDYMANLLARSRGQSAAPSGPIAGPSRAPAAVASRPLPAVVAPALQPEPPPAGEPVAMAPRTVAPERQVDFRAMRQLANVSAKNALHKHESKQLSADTRTKLLVTCVSVVVGVSLLVIHQLPGAQPITIYGAAASFTVAALWGVNYLSLLSRSANERLAYMSRHLKAGEEPVTEVKEEKP